MKPSEVSYMKVFVMKGNTNIIIIKFKSKFFGWEFGLRLVNRSQ